MEKQRRSHLSPSNLAVDILVSYFCKVHILFELSGFLTPLCDHNVQEFLKHEGKKNQGGVPFMFVAIIGLIGIIVGYFIKKT